MLIFNSSRGEVLAPALLRQLGGRWHLASLRHYRRMLPWMLGFNASALLYAICAHVARDDRLMLIAYGNFLLAFSLRQLGVRGAAVDTGTATVLRRASMAICVNVALSTASLALIGFGYLTLPGQLDTPLLRVAGGVMLLTAIGRGVLLLPLRWGKVRR
jgi:hypothetical protein